MIEIKEAKEKDVSLIVDLLSEMQAELKEINFDRDGYLQAVQESFSENVFWFLFYDEKKTAFGLCYMQSVHNYWRLKKRYYLGGFFIQPEFRGQGKFKQIYKFLREWADVNQGGQIYVHIHENNAKSLSVFKSVGMEDVDYTLLVDHWAD